MARSRQRTTGRRESGSFLAIPHRAWRHPRFARLSAHALKLLIDIAGQYNGKNNGDLSAPFQSYLERERHWRSKDTLSRAMKELLSNGWLICTRKGKRIGGTHYPSLYAVTWWPIDASDKHTMETVTAPDTWKEPRP